MASLRTIEASPIENRYARGWHCLGLASDYHDGNPHSLSAFGTRLVAFQGGNQQVHVLDAYCPHMGADLGRGKVCGNSLVCPFHNWSWGGDGVCNSIPYSKVIPPAARVRSWPTCEQNKLLFVWHDPEGAPPPEDLAIPRIDACFSDEWSPWVIEKWTINTNCRELIDNVSDMAHFGAVHGVPVEYFANVFEEHKATQVMLGKSSQPAMEGGLLTYATYFGPAYQITEMKGEMGGMAIDSILLNCHVPLTLRSFDLRFGMLVRRIPGLSEEQNGAITEAYIKYIQQGFYQDVAIWDNKVRIDNPLLCEGDGPIYHLRKWYQQFYVNRAEVAPAARARKVVELNSGALATAPPLHHVFEP
ncbi:MAG TPA: Rieske 2Fe-2S domain-containing protein [Candidatus Binataceae bacterium]|nr:Rieske 2Fe-2S domain-containing protein [Candidatus Binataceae bacterium]